MTDPLPPAAVSLLDAIDRRTARVAVLGLGYAGLPLAAQLTLAGFVVLGHDTDRGRVGRLRRGESYIGHIPSEKIQSLLATGRFVPTADEADLADADVHLLCVPTPLSPAREPDLADVRAAGSAVARRLRPGRLVVLTSTSYPGTARDVLRPILEASGLACGRDFFLAYSPEREDPGNPHYTGARIPRLVGGADASSAAVAVALFRAGGGEVVPTSSMEVAEAAKILENTYRAVNIALVNELKVLYDRAGIDVWEVIEAARTKPFGFQAFYPGPGWGGHCIPIDPFYLAWLGRKLERPVRFVELAGEINTAMTAYVAGKVADALNESALPVKGSRVLVLGVAYKRDIDDVRESPGRELIDLLWHKGALVCYNDPHVPRLEPSARHPLGLQSCPLTAELLAGQDCVLVATDHSAYDWDFVLEHARLVVDSRNATRNVTRHRHKLRKA